MVVFTLLPHRKKPESDEPWVTGPVVKLHFDYVKRDRRERHYVMEDEESAQVTWQQSAMPQETEIYRSSYINVQLIKIQIRLYSA